MVREIRASLVVDGVPASRVVSFEVVHEAGRPFFFEAHVVFGGFIDLEAMVGQEAELSFGLLSEAPRVLWGVVEAATVLGSTERGATDRGTRYHLRVVSRLALLDQSVDSRIFQDMTVKDVVAKVLADHGVDKVDWRLVGSYPEREYVVQYQESALAFVSRLLEHEGIHSFVEPDPDGGERLVFADDSTLAAPMSGDPVLPWRGRGGPTEIGDAVYVLREARRVRSGKFTLRDYDFKRPKLDLTAAATAARRVELEVYDYPGGYTDPADGKRLAQVRLEAHQVEAHVVSMEAVCPRVAVGSKLEITNAGELDGEYVPFIVRHELTHAADGRASYSTSARMLPASVKYRPARVTPVPIVEGPQTATVVAPDGSPNQTIHTDEHGRSKVKFNWDRSPVTNDSASCWIRVQQLQTSGSMMLPRIGWEVVVEFLEGDPDRPVITGRVYNGVLMPPYALPEGKTRTSFKTASTPGGSGTNEIRFEDKAGAEEIMLYAQRDVTVAVANNAKSTIGNNETSIVKNNSSLAVGGGQTTKITKGNSNTIGGNQSVDVTGNRKVEVNAVTAVTTHGASKTSVGADQFEMDGNPLEAMLTIAVQAAATFATAMADNAIGKIQGQVDGAVGQVMGPINGLQNKVNGVTNAMNAVGQGNLGAVGGLVAGAAGLPGAAQLGAQFGAPPGGDGGGGAAPGGAAPSPGVPPVPRPDHALTALASATAGKAISAGATAAQGALSKALGLGGGGGGGESGANAAGPAGDVEGIDATDREKGPGHSTMTVGGAHEEKIGGMKIVGAVRDVDTNVTASKTVDVGAASLELVIGSYSETVGGAKKEKALGLVVLSKGGESENVAGSKMAMVGGAVVDKLKGSHAIQSGGPATFIGAFHKIEAKGAIVFKCGGSELVVDASGVTLKSPMVTIMSPKIQLPKKVTEL